MIEFVAERLARRSASSAPAAAPAGKAITGPGVNAFLYDQPVWSASRNPQAMMRAAAALYHEHPWVRVAERTVSGPAGAIPWHLEDENGETVTDDSDPRLVAIRDLLEKPQANVDTGRPLRRRGLWTLTLRHAGLCGTGAWFLDQTEALAGTPLGILYLAPWRLFPVTDLAGNLLGWTLDKPKEEGGIPLELSQVLPFYLEEPDAGHFGIGLVESAGLKAHLSTSVDRHAIRVLNAGGRLTGIVSPRDANSGITSDQWATFVQDYRSITENPDAARRLQVAQGPIDYQRTAMTLEELDLEFLSRASRDDVLNLWNVPLSQIGATGPAGLNSGETKSYDEAVLWQKAIMPRLEGLRETIQFGLLDRYQELGLKVELILETPTFDDDAPKYDQASKAVDQPLTNAQRLAILGLPPTGDPAIDNAILLPANVVQYAVAPTPGRGEGESKARLTGKQGRALLGLRRTVQERQVPAATRAIAEALREQAGDVAARLRARESHVRRRPQDTAAYWNDAAQDARMTRALRPHALAVVDRVGVRAAEILRRGKAATPSAVPARISDRLARRVVAINARTRDAIRDVIVSSIDRGEVLSEVADRIEDLTLLEGGRGAFDELRAETIARTELAEVYNVAQLETFGEYGVTRVEAIDGDYDPECEERNGQIFTLEEAAGIEDHPNGTLDWAPVFDDEE